MTKKAIPSDTSQHSPPVRDEHPAASDSKKKVPPMPEVDDQPQREDEYLSDLLQEFNPQRKPGKKIEPPPK